MLWDFRFLTPRAADLFDHDQVVRLQLVNLHGQCVICKSECERASALGVRAVARHPLGGFRVGEAGGELALRQQTALIVVVDEVKQGFFWLVVRVAVICATEVLTRVSSGRAPAYSGAWAA
ncbi:MAG: hypothetical protein RJA63_2344 [Pseudomonadota bacterium]